MAKLQDISNAVTTPNGTDIAYLVQDPTGTPVDGKIAMSDLKAYCAPTETDPIVGAVNGIVKADGSGNISAASAGSDYAAPTSGSDILKGDGSGGFSAASAGTDYQAPLTAGVDYQTPLTAGTDYLAPAGDGSSLTGVAHAGDITLGNAYSNASISPATDGTYAIYNDGITTGQVTSITITSGIITGISTL